MNSVKNANSQSHEWFGEINHLLPFSSNGEACHSQVCFLKGDRESPSKGRPCEMQVSCNQRSSLTGEMSLWSGFSVWEVTLDSHGTSQG